MPRLELKSRFGCQEMVSKGNDELSAATFQGMNLVPIICQEEFFRAASKKVRNRPCSGSALPNAPRSRTSAKNPWVKVLSVVRRMSAAPNERVKRIPVPSAELLQCRPSLGAFILARVKNDSPEGGGEALRYKRILHGVFYNRGYSPSTQFRRHLRMADAKNLNPTTRFTGLADCYAKYRPTYAPAAIDCLIRECGLVANSTVVDIGCGTGISSTDYWPNVACASSASIRTPKCWPLAKLTAFHSRRSHRISGGKGRGNGARVRNRQRW